MKGRRGLALAGLLVLLVLACAWPLCLRMSDAASRGRQSDKQRAVAQALEAQDAFTALGTGDAVLPILEIEEAWAIEDVREEADEPLVTAMWNGGDALGYDMQSRTFYCTLGLEHEDWPVMELTARGAQGVQVAWIDDYSYDYLSDALAEGYRYELLAYTDTQVEYIGVVFTGLPIVTLHTQQTITDSNTAARATLAAAGFAPLDSAALVHTRGGGFGKPIAKDSYRLELHALQAGKSDTRSAQSVLGMEPDSDWLLLANAQDETAVRNKLAWDIWNAWFDEGEGLLQLQSEMVELFVNDRYAGIYQLMQRVQEEKEILRAGGNLQTDGVVRITAERNPSTKPLWSLTEEGLPSLMEYRYAPDGDAQRLFAQMADYVLLSQPEGERQLDDETFVQLALERVDIPSMMNYFLFFHACQLRDNISNNIYLFAIRQADGKTRYLHGVWDMDKAFWVPGRDQPEDTLRWPDLSMVLPCRMLDLNVGNCREVLWDIWNEKRQTVLSSGALSSLFYEMEERINAAGAYRREMDRWYRESGTLKLERLEEYEQINMELVEQTLAERWPMETDAPAQSAKK